MQESTNNLSASVEEAKSAAHSDAKSAAVLFGERLRLARALKLMAQHQVAKKIGTNQCNVHYWEKGQHLERLFMEDRVVKLQKLFPKLAISTKEQLFGIKGPMKSILAGRAYLKVPVPVAVDGADTKAHAGTVNPVIVAMDAEERKLLEEINKIRKARTELIDRTMLHDSFIIKNAKALADLTPGHVGDCTDQQVKGAAAQRRDGICTRCLLLTVLNEGAVPSDMTLDIRFKLVGDD
jgi:transcriptional regulator with XRE-family HTH domain